ncbi:MAG: MFS transporter [Desulfobacteraceae bacterium]|nr:MFS transporter [Desulfobacteraceae bacterium]
MNTQEKRILLTTCYGHFMSHFNMLTFPALVLPLAAYLDLPLADVLNLSFYMYVLFGITALPWGLLADRIGARSLMALYYFGAGISGLAVAVWIDSPMIIAIGLGAVGFFSGIYHPIGLGMISKQIRRISVGMGYSGMFGNLGLAMAPLVAGIVNWSAGPRAAFICLGLLNLLGLVVMMLFTTGRDSTAAGKSTGGGNTAALAFFILLIAMMLGGIAYRGASVIMPAYFELNLGDIFLRLSGVFDREISKNLVATGTTSLIFMIGVLGQYIGGRVGERFDCRFAYLLFHCLTIPPVFLMACAADGSLMILALIYFFCLLGMQPIENTLVARYTPKKIHHSAFGTKFVLTFGVGALAVKLVAAIEKSRGIAMVFPVLGICSLLLVLTIVVLIRFTRSTAAISGK